LEDGGPKVAMTNEERRQLSTRVRNLLNGYSIDGDQITWIAVDAEEMLVKVGLNTGVPENLPEKFEGYQLQFEGGGGRVRLLTVEIK